MTRAQDFVLRFVVVSVVWGIAFAWSSMKENLDERFMFLLKTLPWYALVCFGSYALGTIGYNLMTIRDCPEAAAELDKEIIQAKAELSAKGMKFD